MYTRSAPSAKRSKLDENTGCSPVSVFFASLERLHFIGRKEPSNWGVSSKIRDGFIRILSLRTAMADSSIISLKLGIRVKLGANWIIWFEGHIVELGGDDLGYAFVGIAGLEASC